MNFCLNNNCAISRTIIQHKDIHKLTWQSPDGKTVNQIDLVINNKWRRSLKDVHTCRGTATGSKHYLVMSRLKLCLRNAPAKKNSPMKYLRDRSPKGGRKMTRLRMYTIALLKHSWISEEHWQDMAIHLHMEENRRKENYQIKNSQHQV